MSHKIRHTQNKITSEGMFFFYLIKEILVWPISLILVLFGKEKIDSLEKPFKLISDFFKEAKFTQTIIILNFIFYIVSAFLPENILLHLVNSPSNMLSGRLYSLVTSGFLHANIGHLLGNCFFIFVFGRALERKLKISKVAFIYFGAMIISAIFSNLIHFFILGEDLAGIGASGALMGLVSAVILLDPFYITFVFIIPFPIMFVGWTAIYGDITGLLSPIQTNIGHFAHLGGFLSISVLMYFLNDTDKNKLKKGLYINIISLLLAGIVVLIIL